MPSRLTVVLMSLLLATPALISWLWLVIVPLRVTKLCPEECWCDVGGYFVDCSNKSLHNIPSIYLTHVQELVLNNNSITSLEKDIFVSKGLIELNFLALDRCGLQIIELGAFNGLTKLTNLSISENGIEEITGRTFENMSGLEYLGLEYNRIEHLGVDVFWGLVNLQHINLEGNELLKIHPDIFVGLPILERLDLGANGGLQIPTDRHLITSYSLKILNITFCNISSVSLETLANVSALETLDLSYNKLRSIDTNTLRSLPKLSALSLYDNPLQCDCQLQEVWRWCQDHNIRTGSYEADPECDSTSEGKRKWWWVLEELQCVQDNVSNKDGYKQEHNEHPEDEYEQKYKQYMNIMNNVLIPLFIFLSIFGTTGNVIILIIILSNKDMRTVPNMYILNLVICDMIHLTREIVGAFVDTISLYNCTFFTFSFRTSVGLIAYSVAVLGIQRYRVTVNPLHVRVSSKPTWCVAVATICGVWIVAALFAIPSGFSKFLCFSFPKTLRYIAYYKRVVLYELYVFCVFPLLVIAFSYITTARHLFKSSSPISEGTQNPQINARKNAAKIMMGLTVVFSISYVPFHIIWAYFICNVNPNNPMTRLDFIINLFNMLITTSLLAINSCLNPVAIFCTGSQYKEHLKRYLTCFCKANSPPSNIELARRN
jgi:hypothetical protein